MNAPLPDFLTHYYEAARGPDRYVEAQVWDDEALRALGWLREGS
jgi:hypothetical protein